MRRSTEDRTLELLGLVQVMMKHVEEVRLGKESALVLVHEVHESGEGFFFIGERIRADKRSVAARVPARSRVVAARIYGKVFAVVTVSCGPLVTVGETDDAVFSGRGCAFVGTRRRHARSLRWTGHGNDGWRDLILGAGRR
jgi:hypothetical protein